MPSPSSLSASEDEYNHLEATLLNTSGKVPLANRFRALFTLRNLKTRRAIDIIGQGFQDSSALLGHELAYCLGQIDDPYALPALEAVLRDEAQHPMVRHEAAEAMGAISHTSSIPILEEYLHKAGENVSVVETCEIALAKIKHDHAQGSSAEAQASTSGSQRSPYDSIDPAPALSASSSSTSTSSTKQPSSMHDTSASIHSTASLPIPELQSILMDGQKSLFERYRAMFALRNIGPENKEAVLALASGFKDSSALFRHEIAYIFGQLSSEHSVPSLVEVLRDEAEDEMVRHEAAEALGSIATPDVLDTLNEFRHKGPRVVRESCEVALDMYEYETSGQLNYAEAIKGQSAATEASAVAATA